MVSKPDACSFPSTVVRKPLYAHTLVSSTSALLDYSVFEGAGMASKSFSLRPPPYPLCALVKLHDDDLPPDTSHLTPHTSHLIPHSSDLRPQTSHLTPRTSGLLHWALQGPSLGRRPSLGMPWTILGPPCAHMYICSHTYITYHTTCMYCLLVAMPLDWQLSMLQSTRRADDHDNKPPARLESVHTKYVISRRHTGSRPFIRRNPSSGILCLCFEVSKEGLGLAE